MHVLMPLGLFYTVYTPTTQSDVNCLFSVVVYLGIQVDGFDAIFDCITNMIGRFFICKLSSRRHVTMQACKRLDGEESWLLCLICLPGVL